MDREIAAGIAQGVPLIGAVGGLFALVLGHLLAAVGVAFLDRFTLFDYRLWPSWEVSADVCLPPIEGRTA